MFGSHICKKEMAGYQKSHLCTRLFRKLILVNDFGHDGDIGTEIEFIKAEHFGVIMYFF